MTIALRANDGTEIPLSDAQRVDLRQNIGAAQKPVVLTPQEIDSPSAGVLADVDANYRSDAAPFNRYRSDGVRLRAQSEEGHRHVEEDIDGLPALLTQLAADNAAALAASSQALIAATNAGEDAADAQTAASGATDTANAAIATAASAAAAASTAQRTADNAVLAAGSAQTQVDALSSDVGAATRVAQEASEGATQARSDVAQLSGVPFVVLGGLDFTPQARQLVPGSRLAMTDSGPGGTLTIDARTDVATQFTAGQAVAFVDLVMGQGPNHHVAWDARLSNNARLTLTSDGTLENPTGLMDGQPLTLKLKQGEPGGFTLTYADKYRWPGGQAPVLGGTPGEVIMLSFVYDGDDDVLWGRAEAAYV